MAEAIAMIGTSKMIAAFILAVAFTIGVSAVCSLLEAMILSTTTAEIEALKKSKPTSGKRLEYYKEHLEETSSAILGLNTIANTLGATMVGGLAVKIWADGSNVLLNVSISCLLYTSPSPRDRQKSRMPSSA